jgi:hypothetical protein
MQKPDSLQGWLDLLVLTMLAVALLAGLPAAVHAVRIDPASLLRAE